MYASLQIMDENEHQKLQPTWEFLFRFKNNHLCLMAQSWLKSVKPKKRYGSQN
mgnify:CR=1 FL=1